MGKIEIYGRSPALEVLDDLKAWNALSPEERAYAAARHVEKRLGLYDPEQE